MSKWKNGGESRKEKMKKIGPDMYIELRNKNPKPKQVDRMAGFRNFAIAAETGDNKDFPNRETNGYVNKLRHND
jgi:hypothetical protein